MVLEGRFSGEMGVGAGWYGGTGYSKRLVTTCREADLRNLHVMAAMFALMRLRRPGQVRDMSIFKTYPDIVVQGGGEGGPQGQLTVENCRLHGELAQPCAGSGPVGARP